MSTLKTSFAAFAGVVTAVSGLARALPPVPQPAQNPTTEEKRVLGKILFFDEQLSTNNRVACASCHVMGRAGTDPRVARNPGLDGVTPSADDVMGSPGIIRANAANDYLRDVVFAINPQVTGRAAPSPINAAFAPNLFWDGRATSQFTDPQTGQIVIPLGGGGALESQAVGPITNNVEMAHAETDWNAVVAKLETVRPLDLAVALPADVGSALFGNPGYPELFRRAFGDPAITARRIGFAIAAYERTLISSQTPFDSFRAGVPGAMTQQQINGFNTFQALCAVCHATQANGDLLTDNSFRNIGLRPIAEDGGRQGVTGLPGDAGRFKVPGLRNVALKTSFMHNGGIPTITGVVGFYAAPAPFPQNVDPARQGPGGGGLPLGPPGSPQRNDLINFLTNALTDQRVANQQFPFDKPTLFGEPARIANQNTVIQGGALPGTGGINPAIIAENPPMLGTLDFRIGIDGALLGASATLAYTLVNPGTGPITPQFTAGVVTTVDNGNGRGRATVHWPLTPETFSNGQVIFAQWFVNDPGAAGGLARSQVVRIPVFCGSTGCPIPCGYANCDASNLAPFLNVGDFTCFLQRYASGDPYANCDESLAAPALNVADFTCFLQKFALGCP